MFNDLLSKMNKEPKNFVGISLNANGLLEVAITSRVNGSVTKYTNRQVNYNAITREVEGYDTLRDEIENAFDELKLNPKDCNVTMSMPNVLFGIVSLPVMLQTDEVTSALVAEAEESYIFKKAEPVISWTKIGEETNSEDKDAIAMQKIAYCAIQNSAVTELRRIFTEIGVKLISIQNSFSTLMEGLNFSNVINKVTSGNTKSPWNLLFISSTSYSVFNFNNEKLIAYYEEPLAVKAYTNEDVYTAVSSMGSVALQEYPADNLLVISDTDEISAEIISTKLKFNGIPFYLEQNKYQQSPPLDVDLNVLPGFIPQITVSSVGAAVDHFESESGFLKANYLVTKDNSSSFDAGDLITIGDYTFELNKDKAQKFTLIALGAILVVFGALFGFLSFITQQAESELSKLVEKEAQLQQEVSQNQGQEPVANIMASIDTVVKDNRRKMLYYDALSYGIPEKLWIEHFYAGPNKVIGINGVAVESSDIALFLKGIRDVAGESGVSVTKLTITGDDRIIESGPELYAFELASSGYQGQAITNQNAQNQNNQPSMNMPSSNIPPADSRSVAPPVIPAE